MLLLLEKREKNSLNPVTYTPFAESPMESQTQRVKLQALKSFCSPMTMIFWRHDFRIHRVSRSPMYYPALAY